MSTILAFGFLLSVIWGAYHIIEISRLGLGGYLRARAAHWYALVDAHERYQQSREAYARQLGEA